MEVVSSAAFTINQEWISRIKKLARLHPEHKYRTCFHSKDDDVVHEMLIAHTNDTYVRPHRHRLHRESLHIVEGKATVVLFTNEGGIDTIWKVGDISTGRPFFYSLDAQIFHTLVVETPDIIFKETTQGPFVGSDQQFPDWAPSGFDGNSGIEYLRGIRSAISEMG